jgi:hypothetical protein
MRLATHDIRFENNAVHPDVADAWLRAPHSDRSLPFKAHRIEAGGGTIQAVDFDMGRNGVAYFDTNAANESGKPNTDWNPSALYRNDGVDIVRDEGGVHVVDMVAGEWMQYTVESVAAARATLRIVVGEGRVRVRLNGDVVGEASAGGTIDVALQPGRNTLRIEAATAVTALRALEFNRAD